MANVLINGPPLKAKMYKRSNMEGQQAMCRLWIGNLPIGISNLELESLIKKICPVHEIYLPGPSPTGINRGFAVAVIDGDTAMSEKCVKAFNSCIWKGTKIKVEIAKEQYSSKFEKERQCAQMIPVMKQREEPLPLHVFNENAIRMKKRKHAVTLTISTIPQMPGTKKLCQLGGRRIVFDDNDDETIVQESFHFEEYENMTQSSANIPVVESRKADCTLEKKPDGGGQRKGFGTLMSKQSAKSKQLQETSTNNIIKKDFSSVQSSASNDLLSNTLSAVCCVENINQDDNNDNADNEEDDDNEDSDLDFGMDDEDGEHIPSVAPEELTRESIENERQRAHRMIALLLTSGRPATAVHQDAMRAGQLMKDSDDFEIAKHHDTSNVVHDSTCVPTTATATNDVNNSAPAVSLSAPLGSTALTGSSNSNSKKTGWGSVIIGRYDPSKDVTAVTCTATATVTATAAAPAGPVPVVFSDNQDKKEKTSTIAATVVKVSDTSLQGDAFANLDQLKSIFHKDDGVWFGDTGSLKEMVAKGAQDSLFLEAEKLGLDIRDNSASNTSCMFNFFGEDIVETSNDDDDENNVGQHDDNTNDRAQEDMENVANEVEEDVVNEKKAQIVDYPVMTLAEIIKSAKRFRRERSSEVLTEEWKASKDKFTNDYKRKRKDARKRAMTNDHNKNSKRNQ